MRLSTLLLVLAALGAAVGGILLLRPARDTPEVQVRAAVDAMARAARAHDPGGVLDRFSDGFTSPELGGKAELRSFLLGELLRGGTVEARVLDGHVEAMPGGEVRFTGRLLLGRTAGGMELGQRVVEATFVDEGGTFRVARAHVEPVQ